MTHDELTARVAREIAERLESAVRICAAYEQGPTSDDYEAAAQAAINAIREALAEPTPEMVEAGEDELNHLGCNTVAGDAAFLWNAMFGASPLGERREG